MVTTTHTVNVFIPVIETMAESGPRGFLIPVEAMNMAEMFKAGQDPQLWFSKNTSIVSITYHAPAGETDPTGRRNPVGALAVEVHVMGPAPEDGQIYEGRFSARAGMYFLSVQLRDVKSYDVYCPGGISPDGGVIHPFVTTSWLASCPQLAIEWDAVNRAMHGAKVYLASDRSSYIVNGTLTYSDRALAYADFLRYFAEAIEREGREFDLEYISTGNEKNSGRFFSLGTTPKEINETSTSSS